MGCMLGQILEMGYRDLEKNDLEKMLRFANAAASIITTRRGALRVMPEKDEIIRLFANLLNKSSFTHHLPIIYRTVYETHKM